jgi:hypothetical protein
MNADGKRQPEMHDTTKRSGATTSGSCMVRDPGVRDLVLWQVLNQEGIHKFSPSWEGPFKVTEACRPRSARLATNEGVPLPCP